MVGCWVHNSPGEENKRGMDNDMVGIAGRVVVGGFVLAFVMAVIMFAVQVGQRFRDWWRDLE